MIHASCLQGPSLAWGTVGMSGWKGIPFLSRNLPSIEGESQVYTNKMMKGTANTELERVSLGF